MPRKKNVETKVMQALRKEWLKSGSSLSFEEWILTVDPSERITTFVKWLEDNHSIHIHDMIVTDFLRYGK